MAADNAATSYGSNAVTIKQPPFTTTLRHGKQKLGEQAKT